jgi:serine/threonine-protein kinase
VLGPFTLERDGETIDTTRWQRRVEVLFKLLLTAPDRQRRRDDLIDILWPDADPENGVGNLRMLVHRLRSTIDQREPPPVLSEGGWIALNPECEWELDLEVLEAAAVDPAAGSDELEQAATLYRGEPLLEDRYEDWAQAPRERANHAWRAVCIRLGLQYASRAAHDSAVRWFERALEADPFDEDAFRQLLTVLHAAGRSAEALRRYAVLERLFLDELDVAPSPDTQALAASIREARDEPADPSRTPAPAGDILGPAPELSLCGRDQEMEIALAASRAAASGAGRLVVLSGEQGIGKTRLAREIAQRMFGEGFLIAVGRCSRRQRPVSWAPVLDALAILVAAPPAPVRARIASEWTVLKGLLSGSRDLAATSSNEVGQRQLFLAVSRFLRAVAGEQPVGIVLDDLHWADDATLDLLHHLARELRSSRVLLLGTCSDAEMSRQHPVSQALRDMAQEGLVERIALRRLSPDETAGLVRGALGDAPGIDAFADYVYRRTRGIPFFIDRLLHVLGGRYRLVKPVGAGGMGWVFEAEDVTSGDRVAVKIIFARREAEPRMLVRFQQEAAALARLEHPSIVKIRDAAADEYGGRIVMDLLTGRSLAASLPPEGLTLASIKGIALQVADALSCAHEHGILHRDIKPENIVVDGEGHATLTDFGIARVLWPDAVSTTLTATSAAFGTSTYMAPEQVERSREDARSDVYSLGVVLYELATGSPPFQGDDPMSVAIKHLQQVPTPPSIARAGLPADWDAVISRCLAKAPSERFQSAAALEKAIESLSTPGLAPLADVPPQESAYALASPPVNERNVPPPAGRQIPGRLGRLRGWPGVAAAVLVLLIGTGTYFGVEHWGLPGHSAASPGNHGVPPARSDVGPRGSGPGQFEGPSGISIDPRGSIWVADSGNDRVQELSPAGVPLAQRGSPGNGTGQFNTPQGLAVTSQGNIWVEDRKNGRIEKIAPSGDELDELYEVGPIAVAGVHNYLYVADLPHHLIREFSWNKDPLGIWSIPDVRVERRPFPAGIAVDGQGRVYVVDRAKSRVLVLTPHGAVMAPTLILGADPRQYRFNHPSDVALDHAGNIYVADTRNNRVVVLSRQGKFLRAWGTPGKQIGQFNQPSSLAVDRQGNVYVTDYFLDRVQKFSPTGMLLWATNGRSPLRP